MLVEVSVLKNFPSSCLNSDDLGAPKSVIFGGVERARYSSQSKKQALRSSDLFETLLKQDVKAIRTRKLFDPVLIELEKLGIGSEYVTGVKKLLSSFGKKADGKAKEEKEDKERKSTEKEDKEEFTGTTQLMAYSQEDIQLITKIVKEMIDEAVTPEDFDKKLKSKKDFASMITKLHKSVADAGVVGISLDTALFGRMAATKSLSNIEAAMQVAHAFSTHMVTQETDFFVAMDDLVMAAGEQGAAMMGDVEYNSACYYEYANIDVDKVISNMRNSQVTVEEIKAAIGNLVKAFTLVNPNGKQNTFAAHILPSLVMVEIKDTKVPMNYSNAFVKPARPDSEHDIVESSVIKLATEVNKADKFFGLDVVKRLWLDTTDVMKPENCEVCNSLQELVDSISNIIINN